MAGASAHLLHLTGFSPQTFVPPPPRRLDGRCLFPKSIKSATFFQFWIQIFAKEVWFDAVAVHQFQNCNHFCKHLSFKDLSFLVHRVSWTSRPPQSLKPAMFSFFELACPARNFSHYFTSLAILSTYTHQKNVFYFIWAILSNYKNTQYVI